MAKLLPLIFQEGLGFKLPEYEELIPCPFCGSNHCRAVKQVSENDYKLVCSNTFTKAGTFRVVSIAALRRSAKKHNIPKID